MACCGGGAGFGSFAYEVTYVNAEGEKKTHFVESMGAFRMFRGSVKEAGGEVSKAVQVPRKKMDEWLAQQDEAA